jgi:methylmalonyl-CoA mutase cobalamin-binding subunit
MVFLQWLWEEEEGFHATLAAKLIKECQSEGAEHIYLILVM